MIKTLIIIIFVALLSSFQSAYARLDLDGNGVSEIWELKFPNLPLENGADSDGDGQSNRVEGIAGTDPMNPNDSFLIREISVSGDEAFIHWAGKAGKKYCIEQFDVEENTWNQIHTVALVLVDGNRAFSMPVVSETVIIRVTAKDVDIDGDGLTAWEEIQIGLSDDDAFSNGDGLPDFQAALRDIESVDGVALADGSILARRLPTAGEASRFLVQSSFGPTMEAISEVMAAGIVGYLDQQMALPATRTRVAMFQTGFPVSADSWRFGWWKNALIAPDQLRQRMAYALSQIFVLNTEAGSVIGDNVLTQAAYYDQFIVGGFSSYRDLLEHVTYSPAMGFYLSHLNNRKSDPAENRFPDENFAREIMQLFSIGLWKLNPDGSRELDSDGNSIPTYDNSVIVEMAKIFTGMSNGTTMRGRTSTSFYDTATGADYIAPMIVWDEEHEGGAKTIFNGLVISEGQTGEEDVQQTLDALSEHANVAPFISRLLIQRFTSSNPSPEYLSRVSSAWTLADGNLEKVIRAILLDSEARVIDRGHGDKGKIREPIIRMLHTMRAFAPPLQNLRFKPLFNLLNTELGQFPMSSPSVFNFYLPDYEPDGLLGKSGLTSPELQIATTSRLLATHDRLKDTAATGHWVWNLDYTDELELVSSPEELADRYDILFTYGEMSPVLRAAVINGIIGESADIDKARIPVQTIVVSPEFTVLK